MSSSSFALRADRVGERRRVGIGIGGERDAALLLGVRACAGVARPSASRRATRRRARPRARPRARAPRMQEQLAERARARRVVAFEHGGRRAAVPDTDAEHARACRRSGRSTVLKTSAVKGAVGLGALERRRRPRRARGARGAVGGRGQPVDDRAQQRRDAAPRGRRAAQHGHELAGARRRRRGRARPRRRRARPASRYFSSSASSHSATASTSCARARRPAAAAHRCRDRAPRRRLTNARRRAARRPRPRSLAPLADRQRRRRTGRASSSVASDSSGGGEVGALAVDAVHERDDRQAGAPRGAPHALGADLHAVDRGDAPARRRRARARRSAPSPWKFASPGVSTSVEVVAGQSKPKTVRRERVLALLLLGPVVEQRAPVRRRARASGSRRRRAAAPRRATSCRRPRGRSGRSSVVLRNVDVLMALFSLRGRLRARARFFSNSMRRPSSVRNGSTRSIDCVSLGDALREAAGRDHARLGAELAADALDHRVHHAGVAEEEARLERLRRGPADHRARPRDLDAVQHRGARRTAPPSRRGCPGRSRRRGTRPCPRRSRRWSRCRSRPRSPAPPTSSKAATEFTMRSAPTSRGFS